MTHEELLGNINLIIKAFKRFHLTNAVYDPVWIQSFVAHKIVAERMSSAIVAVIQLHKPDSFESDGETITICPECNYEYRWSTENNDGRYPCDTIKAIMEEVNV